MAWGCGCRVASAVASAFGPKTANDKAGGAAAVLLRFSLRLYLHRWAAWRRNTRSLGRRRRARLGIGWSSGPWRLFRFVNAPARAGAFPAGESLQKR